MAIDLAKPFLALRIKSTAQGFSSAYLSNTDGLGEGMVHAGSLTELSIALQSAIKLGWTEQHRGLLLVDADSIAAAFDFPWETIDWAGRPLREQAIIVRGHRWIKPPSSGRAGSIRWLNLFPPGEYHFREFQPWIRSGRLRPAQWIGLGRDLHDCVETFVLAHGDARGILDREGFPVRWPASLPTPRYVWLLACAEGDAMSQLAQHFLRAGTETVFCATNRLDAQKMAGLVCERLQALDQDPAASPIHTLLSLTGKAGSSEDGGAATLTVWGDLPLDTSAGAPWNHAHWARWSGRRPCQTLDDRHTAADLASVMASWRSGHLWPITEKSLHPTLVWAAERHDHEAMLELRSRAPLDSGAKALRARAKEARRIGDYPRAIDSVATALSQSPDMPIRKDLLLLRANILIDMNLPVAAQTDLRDHENCADCSDDELARSADEAKRLDALARSWIRCGQPDTARDKLERKLSLSATGALGDDRTRVQTSLLYQLAWGLVSEIPGREGRRRRALELAQWAAEQLSAVSATNTPAANDDNLYLARALAAYAWATKDNVVAQMLIPWRQTARDRFGDIDPGPWSYIILFGYLMAPLNLAFADHTDYQRAQDALKESRYDLESAVFAALAGDEITRDDMYRRFVGRRNRLLQNSGDPATAVEAEQRGAIENAALRTTDEALTRRMVVTGVMPL